MNFSNLGLCKIPLSDIITNPLPGLVLRASNSWFGEKYGKVVASCLDKHGYPHQDIVTASVYYPTNTDISGNLTPPLGMSTKQPLWFYFWTQDNVVEGLNVFQYDGTLSSCGNSAPTLGPLSRELNCRKWIKSYNDMNSIPFQIHETGLILGMVVGAPLGTNNGTYITSVAYTVAHEEHHQLFSNCISFPFLTPGHTDSDGISDGEEDNPSSFSGAKRSDKNKYDTFAFRSGSGYSTPNGCHYEDNEVRVRHFARYNPKTVHHNKNWEADDRNINWKN